MRIRIVTHVAAAAFALAIAMMPVLADDYPGRDRDRGRATPGPLAGAGIGYLIAAGSYGVYRFWRRGK